MRPAVFAVTAHLGLMSSIACTITVIRAMDNVSMIVLLLVEDSSNKHVKMVVDRKPFTVKLIPGVLLRPRWLCPNVNKRIVWLKSRPTSH